MTTVFEGLEFYLTLGNARELSVPLYLQLLLQCIYWEKIQFINSAKKIKATLHWQWHYMGFPE